MSLRKLRRHAPVLVGAALLLILTLAVWFGLSKVLDGGGAKTKKMVQQISLIKPPPPPPPPKVEEKPPEPKVKEEVKIDEPPPKNDDQPPPGKDLGIDANGSGGGDGFGLIGRKGGRDLLGSDRFGWYGSQVKSGIYDALMGEDCTRQARYSVVVKVWLVASGKVQRVELEGSSGNPEIDSCITRALPGVQVADAPPEDLPQPVRIRVAARM